MPLIKKILFPVDFSESCIGAARYVEAFAGHFQAEVMLLHTVGMGEYHLPEELVPSRKVRLDAFLADEFKYFTTQRVCLTGDPAPDIVDTARCWHPDLVMMATHGLGAFRRLLIGSVTAKVLHDLHLPIWTSVHAETAPPLEKIHCRRILCAIDLSPRSQNILEWAAWLADEYDADLGIAHATEALPDAYLAGDLEGELKHSLVDNAERRIGVLQSAVGITGPVLVKPGDPAKVIACAAKQFGADLLVMGRHSTAGVTGYLRQSAWDILRDSPCPAISI
jgi:nucleotide-binding universal stress UspA family protein